MEFHGLCTPVGFNRRAQNIATPVVYMYVKKAEQNVERRLNTILRS